jgi:hypothetical protein
LPACRAGNAIVLTRGKVRRIGLADANHPDAGVIMKLTNDTAS